MPQTTQPATITKLATSARKARAIAEVPLTEQEARFVAEYLKDRNGTRAARVAGFSRPDLSQYAYELLRRTEIRMAIAKTAMDIARKVKVSESRIIEETAAIAFSPIVPGLITADHKLKALNLLGQFMNLWDRDEEGNKKNPGDKVFNIQIFNIDRGLL